jgi:Zn-dependent protease
LGKRVPAESAIMTGNLLAELAVWYLAFVFSTTCHEAAHALAAYLGGDSTAYHGGQVTLDPVPHIAREPFGMVVLPILSFLVSFMSGTGGWMLGWASTPYDPYWGQRYPRRRAVMSVAGPAANFAVALTALGIAKVLMHFDVLQLGPGADLAHLFAVVGQDGYSSPLGAISMLLSVLVALNVLLGVFNLMPIPPLDGASVLEGIAPKVFQPIYSRFYSMPVLSLLGMVLAWKLFPYVGWPVFGFVRDVFAF